ncbi:MAG: murein biosynthesis integral membrane protein MurJ [Candidatus Peregrinibacteria bacterium]|nr:murein biosynthesis integral membrane protein MurJ [Candidatus Peregrinibacteria bacterium]
MIRLLTALREKHDLKTLFFYSSWSLTLTSGLSYVFGFLRDRLFAQTFGLSRTLDIYNASFVLPDLLQSLFIGTALSAAFVPIFTKLYDEKKSLGYQYAHQVMTLGVTLIAGVGVLAAIFLPLLTDILVPGFEGEELKQYIMLTRVMLFSPILFAMSMTYGRILISVKEFFWWGLSPALYNMGIILGGVYLYPKFGILGLVLGTLFGALLHLLNRLRPLRKKKYNFKTKIDFTFSPEIIETIKLALPKMLQYGMFHFMLMSFTSITSTLPEGSVALYGYARNFQSLPVSLLGIAIALAMYPTLSHDAGKGNYEKFKRDFRRNRLKSLFYTTLAAIALALLSKFVVSLLLGGGRFGAEEIELLASVLMVYCISVPLESMMHIYHRAFYSLRNTTIPSFMHAFTIALTILMAINLKDTIGIYAIPVSFASGLALHITVLATVFPILLKKRTDMGAHVG